MRRNRWGERVHQQPKKYSKFTKEDEYISYLKIFGIFVLGAIYFYLIWL